MKLSKYVNDNYIKLSNEEIFKLFDNRTKNKNTIVKSQLPFLLKIADSFSKTTKSNIDDLFSDGLIVLSKSIDDFITINNVPFTSYFKTCLNNKFVTITNRVNNKNTVNYTYPFSSFDYDFNKESSTNYEPNYNENEIINIIKKNLNTKQSDIVIKYLGISGDVMTFKEISEEYNQSYQNIAEQYHIGLRKLKKVIKIS
jgi:RNA polymerase sigma factor (sigma-70 family)